MRYYKGLSIVFLFLFLPGCVVPLSETTDRDLMSAAEDSAADSKVTALPELTDPVGADLLMAVDDVAGTPTSSKLTLTNLFTSPLITTPTLAGAVSSNTADGAAAIAFDFADPSYTTAGSKLFQITNNTDDAFWVNYAGAIHLENYNTGSTVDIDPYGGGITFNNPLTGDVTIGLGAAKELIISTPAAFSVDLTALVSETLGLRMYPLARTADLESPPLTLKGGDAYASATGTNRNGGPLNLESGDGIAGGANGDINIDATTGAGTDGNVVVTGGNFSVDNAGSIYHSGGYKALPTVVNVATYDLLVTDRILHVTYTATAAVTSLTLPTAQCDGAEDDGRMITIKDAGNAGTNNITIDTEGSETIDGAATLVIISDYDAPSLYCQSSNWWIY